MPRRGHNSRKMLKMAVQQGAASEEARRTLQYVGDLNDVRTPLTGFFSRLLVCLLRRERGEVKWLCPRLIGNMVTKAGFGLRPIQLPQHWRELHRLCMESPGLDIVRSEIE